MRVSIFQSDIKRKACFEEPAKKISLQTPHAESDQQEKSKSNEMAKLGIEIKKAMKGRRRETVFNSKSFGTAGVLLSYCLDQCRFVHCLCRFGLDYCAVRDVKEFFASLPELVLFLIY